MPRVITARRWRGGRGGRGGGSGGRGGGGGGLGRVVGEAEEREGVEALAAEGALAQRHLQLECEGEGEDEGGRGWRVRAARGRRSSQVRGGQPGSRRALGRRSQHDRPRRGLQPIEPAADAGMSSGREASAAAAVRSGQVTCTGT